jgi:hypothetical protein
MVIIFVWFILLLREHRRRFHAKVEGLSDKAGGE